MDFWKGQQPKQDFFLRFFISLFEMPLPAVASLPCCLRLPAPALPCLPCLVVCSVLVAASQRASAAAHLALPARCVCRVAAFKR